VRVVAAPGQNVCAVVSDKEVGAEIALEVFDIDESDEVRAARRVTEHQIGIRATGRDLQRRGVGPASAVEYIVAAALARQAIVTGPAQEHIVAFPAVQGVVAVAPDQEVGPDAAVQIVVTVSPHQPVIAIFAP
jgi:hypothetical protein